MRSRRRERIVYLPVEGGGSGSTGLPIPIIAIGPISSPVSITQFTRVGASDLNVTVSGGYTLVIISTILLVGDVPAYHISTFHNIGNDERRTVAAGSIYRLYNASDTFFVFSTGNIPIAGFGNDSIGDHGEFLYLVSKFFTLSNE